jgi:hypothetical protein
MKTEDISSMSKDEITRYKTKVYEQRPFGPKQWEEINRINRQIEKIEEGNND